METGVTQSCTEVQKDGHMSVGPKTSGFWACRDMAIRKPQYAWKSGVQLEGISGSMNAAVCVKNMLKSFQRGTKALGGRDYV
jgi:hypothetical protein